MIFWVMLSIILAVAVRLCALLSVSRCFRGLMRLAPSCGGSSQAVWFSLHNITGGKGSVLDRAPGLKDHSE